MAHHYQCGCLLHVLNLISTLKHQCWCHQSLYCRIALPTNYHHQLQETCHVSLPFITIGPGTDSAGLGDINYWIGPVQVFVGRSNSSLDTQKHRTNCSTWTTDVLSGITEPTASICNLTTGAKFHTRHIYTTMQATTDSSGVGGTLMSCNHYGVTDNAICSAQACYQPHDSHNCTLHTHTSHHNSDTEAVAYQSVHENTFTAPRLAKVAQNY